MVLQTVVLGSRAAQIARIGMSTQSVLRVWQGVRFVNASPLGPYIRTAYVLGALHHKYKTYVKPYVQPIRKLID